MAGKAPEHNESKEGGIESYRIHVSRRWLDLTKQKLRLSRLPRVPAVAATIASQQDSPVSRAELEPLIDYWQDAYDDRAEEERYNDCLPQYRVKIETNSTVPQADGKRSTALRVHFVHRRSSEEGAVPLLYCHDFGSSFAEVRKIIEPLCEPVSTPTPVTGGGVQAFHLVCPSIPGFGFSDASADAKFGLEGTASAFKALMHRLGYDRFLLHGFGWGFKVCRALALHYPDSCMGVHTANISVPRPTLSRTPVAWLQYHVARLTTARIGPLSFGYTPSDFASCVGKDDASQSPNADLFPHTLTYGLSDSPSTLLAVMLHLIQPPKSVAFQSAFDARPQVLTERPAWTPADVVFWTLMYWLPGPESALRWLRKATQESTDAGPLWTQYSPVPLGISVFSNTPACRVPPAWAASYQRLSWITRHDNAARWPAWESPDLLVMDLRRFAECACCG